MGGGPPGPIRVRGAAGGQPARARGRGGPVGRVDAGTHGDLDGEVAGGDGLGLQAVALRAHHKRKALRAGQFLERDAVVVEREGRQREAQLLQPRGSIGCPAARAGDARPRHLQNRSARHARRPAEEGVCARGAEQYAVDPKTAGDAEERGHVDAVGGVLDDEQALAARGQLQPRRAERSAAQPHDAARLGIAACALELARAHADALFARQLREGELRGAQHAEYLHALCGGGLEQQLGLCEEGGRAVEAAVCQRAVAHAVALQGVHAPSPLKQKDRPIRRPWGFQLVG